MDNKRNGVILAGDVGGTKCNLALFQENAGKLQLIFQRRYATKDYASLSFQAIVEDFCHHADEAGTSSRHIVAAGFGSAGAVVDGRFHSANLPWVLEGKALANTIGLESVAMLNDLEATACSLDRLPAKDLLVLNKGVPQPKAARALIAAGTGLGEAILFWDGRQYQVVPSEGGQADFAPRTEREIGLLHFLKKRASHVSLEEVLSGRGFLAIHQFLDASVQHPCLDLSLSDAAQVITQNALSSACSVCVDTLDLWISAYGSEAGNLALRVLAFGGIYVAGGIAIKILPKMQDGEFFRAFCDKGTLAQVLAHIPIYVVLNEEAPLWGAAYRALGKHSL